MCSVPDRQLSDEDVDELCIGLNLHQGAFDYDILGNLWDPLDLLQYGFSEKQLFDYCQKDEEIEEVEEKEKKKRKKLSTCPSCGCEF